MKKIINFLEENRYSIFVLAFFFSILLFYFGINSEVCLGDENFHYRFAKSIFHNKKIIPYDPVYGREYPIYIWSPFWHIGLAFFWNIFGKISFILAQLYQTIYYFFLIIFTYLITYQLYGRRPAIYSALIIAATPMIVSFGILFYVDVPATALATMAVWLIFKNRFLLSGIAAGAMFLTKENTFFFIPACLLWICFSSKGYSKKIKNLFLFILPVLIFVLGYLLLQRRNITQSDFYILTNFLKRIKSFNISYLFSFKEYNNSYLTNPIDIVKYFGVIIIFFIFIYFYQKKFRDIKNNIFIYLLLLFYLIGFALTFGFNTDIRYILPITAFLVVILSEGASAFKNLILKSFLIIICFMQFLAVCGYVKYMRKIPQDLKEGFKYINENLPSDKGIIYPEYGMMLEKTNRPIHWFKIDYELKQLFWNDNNRLDIVNQLKERNINYLAIRKSRIYDDSKIRHLGGYPLSFINRLKDFKFLKPIFENKQIIIFKMN